MRKVGAEWSCVDVVLDTDRRYALMLDVFLLRCSASGAPSYPNVPGTSICILCNYRRRTNSETLCEVFVIHTAVFLRLKYSIEISVPRIRYQVPLKGSLIIEKKRTGIHRITSMNVIVLQTGGILYY